MLRNQQNLNQKQQQSLQQKLSPQQLQYIKLLQLPAMALEQRIKEEMEANPVLEEVDPGETETVSLSEVEESPKEEKEEALESLEEHEVDWDDYDTNTEYEGETYSTNYNPDAEEWRDLPNPYQASFLEELEEQVSLLNFTDEEQLIADQILGSLDEDGYFRRETEAVVDNIAFNEGVLVDEDMVEDVRKQIQQLEPLGIASRDLRDCLLVQLRAANTDLPGRDLAIDIVENAWKSFEKKHFKKLLQKFNIDREELQEAFQAIRHMDPRPGSVASDMEETQNYIEPDFEVYWRSASEGETTRGEFVINLNQRNAPSLRISPEYKQMWEEIKAKKKKNTDTETRTFMKSKIDSAQWFIESIRQRQNTLMNIMKTIVALQEDFFKYGEGLKPMILKDVAERIGMDISTVSRVVNGKYVQTHSGVFELKYFFNEGLETESGEEVSNREVKNILQDLIDNEDKQKPYSDQELTNMLNDKGYKVARRTVSKYREQLNEPVARMRKQVI
ncbi:RNA polymerase factor sigma-54 [Gracilimonas mengyeensis]|uniref:RNA polymerase, sigma 54 subunit, RpoN/SigL n=1 Tax=Gracilimonas mengyeensis TaxID=1302730 RepID=A0A521BI99_9BACT|nr:RNA polymerase factor sigma-54 [Gracilimonas mengyeensis]SMO46823.1 RNA polymerase, sigma 54 subunit, RpoN/SigL [Gracilimonas mengyeensis]